MDRTKVEILKLIVLLSSCDYLILEFQRIDLVSDFSINDEI